MTEQQIPKLAAALVEHQQAFASLPTDDAQWVIQNTKQAIALFVSAVQARAQNVVVEVMVAISTILSLIGITFSSTGFLGEGWAIWKGPIDGDGLEGEKEEDARALAMTELDVAKMQFETCLNADEGYITGGEKLKRLRALGKILLGTRQFLALWQDHQKNKEHNVLEWLFKERGITHLDFFGTILRDPRRRRCVLYLYRNDNRWYWNFYWLGDDAWGTRRTSAVLESEPSDC